jgi:hypothetical protein
VKLFISEQSGLGMFQFLLGDSGIFFGCVPFPSDQVYVVVRWTSVAYDPEYFIFFFTFYKVRWWSRKVWAMNGVFTIGR